MVRNVFSKGARKPINALAASGMGKGKRKKRDPGTGEKAIERAQRALTKAAATRDAKPGRFSGS